MSAAAGRHPRFRVDLEPVYVVHYRRYRETSLLIEALSRDHGRVGLVARGARRPRSPLRGLLQPFHPLLATWTARGELGTLLGAETRRAAPRLGGRSLLSGIYLNELVYRTVHRYDPHPGLFAAYEDALDGLRTDGEGTEGVLRLFEKRLLDAIGYGLVLDREAGTGGAIAAERSYRYEHQHGPVALGEPAAAGTGAEPVISGATIIALECERLDGAVQLGEAKRLLRAALAPYLGAQPLRSREMFPRTTTRQGPISPGSSPGSSEERT